MDEDVNSIAKVNPPSTVDDMQFAMDSSLSNQSTI